MGLGEDENIFIWEILLVGPPDTLYEGGFFNAKLEFPPDFPNMPPVMTFTTQIWHPNGTPCLNRCPDAPSDYLTDAVYDDGKVCISILHPPGEDRFNQQETAAERWRPILGVESIIMSVISMLSDPNDDSPANIDAAVMWRNDRAAFKKKVREFVRRSQECI